MAAMQRTKGQTGELLATHIDGYSVTSDGRVFSHKSGKWLSPAITPRGYVVYGLRHAGACRTYFAHRLVACAFIGPRPAGGVVNHIDGDKLNNRAENLEWCSSSENNRHAYRLGLKTAPCGELARQSKLTDEAVTYIRTSGEPKKAMARRFGVNIKTIYQAFNGETWRRI